MATDTKILLFGEANTSIKKRYLANNQVSFLVYQPVRVGVVKRTLLFWSTPVGRRMPSFRNTAEIVDRQERFFEGDALGCGVSINI